MPSSALVRGRIENLLERPWVLALGGLWGFAEATLFFVVPDVLLTFVALYSPRRSVKLVTFILLGALAGGTLMFHLGVRNPKQAETLVLRVPFVSSAMFEKTHEGFKRDGIWTLAKAPGNGIPYKVYCVQAGRYANWSRFLLVSLLARLERFAPFWIVSVALGLVFRGRIRRRPVVPAVAHIILWILGYAWYWSSIA
jgi:membrane protein DedA with SNARE-associated domain